MKKKYIILAVFSCLTFMISLSGCSNPFRSGRSGTSGGQDVIVPTPDLALARVVVQFPTANQRARGVGLGSAVHYTNYFEVFFRRTDIEPNTFHSASAMYTEGNIEIEIPVGTYDILLLAGFRSQLGDLLALASSYVLDRNIVLGPVNRIQMELATLDINIIAPDIVNVAEPFTVHVEFYTRNPILARSDSGLNLLLMFLSLDNVALPNPHFLVRDWDDDFLTYTPNLWVTESFYLVAPLALTESSLSVHNAGGGFRPFRHEQFSSWRLADNRAWAWIPYGLISYFARPISFISNQTMPEVEIEITWPDN